MHRRLGIGLLVSWIALKATAQTAFIASWNFENNPNGSSNSPNVAVSSLGVTGVTVSGYPAGQTGDAISLQFWPTGGLSTGDYVAFSVTPQNYRFSLSSVAFDFNRSTDGPTQLAVRSSQDNFAGNIGTASVTATFANLNIPLFVSDAENTVTFRIYGYASASSPGTLRLDNLKVNGTVTVVPLPVELTYFRGQIFDNQVQLSWETAWERNAARFEVQRSSDLKEFITLHTLTATGDTRDRSRYTFTDKNPLPGTGYYRLRQSDRNGKFEFSKIISVNLDTDFPQIWLYENPTSAHQIRVRLQKLTPADLQLFSLTGQAIPFSWQSLTSNDYLLQTITPLGWYWLAGHYQGRRISQKIRLNER